MDAERTRNETVQLVFLLTSLVFVFAVFFLTPSLRPASLITVVNLLFMAPAVRFLMRKKVPKVPAILILFVIYGFLLVFGAIHAVRILISQWASLVSTLPVLGESVIFKLGRMQTDLQTSLGIEFDFGVDNWLINLQKNIQTWTFTNAPTIIGDVAAAGFLSPVFAFFLLKDGDQWKNEIRKLMPERYRTTTVHVVDRISEAVIKFLRAKVLEALLVGVLCYIGLKIIAAPYAGIFALIAGVTNIIPYLGPVLGSVPALILIGFSDQYVSLFWPAFFVFAIVNLVDNVLIFPVFVAKLVNLSPLTLLVSVAVGQEFYGLVGMLLAVPFASSIKIIFQELRGLLY